MQSSRRRSGKVCFRCNQEGHFPRDCSRGDYYRHRFQYFCDIADAAPHFPTYENRKADDSDHEVLAYFADANKKPLRIDEQHDEADETLDVWIADMLSRLDKSDLSSPALPLSSTIDYTLYGSIPLSIPDLKDNVDTLTLFSTASADQHLPLDTGAPRSICSDEWLQKANWTPLKMFKLPTSKLPFRFPGHSVSALYGV